MFRMWAEGYFAACGRRGCPLEGALSLLAAARLNDQKAGASTCLQRAWLLQHTAWAVDSSILWPSVLPVETFDKIAQLLHALYRHGVIDGGPHAAPPMGRTGEYHGAPRI